MPNSNVIDKAGDLHTKWKLAQERRERYQTDEAEQAEQAAYDELIDYVEAHDLNYTEYDPRGQDQAARLLWAIFTGGEK